MSLKRILAAIAAVIIILGLSFAIYKSHDGKYDDWIQVPGSVIEIRSHRGFRHTVYYIYNDGDKILEGQDSYANRTSDYYSVGQGVEVWMNPDNHEDCSLHKPNAGLGPYAPICLGFPIVMIILFANPKNRKPGKPKTQLR